MFLIDMGLQCDVKFDADEYTLRATENYSEGDEVYMSYGGHPNDFLLAECKPPFHCMRRGL